MQLDERLLRLIGEVLVEKRDSLRSKFSDGTAIQDDTVSLAFAEEVIALAKNRWSVWQNEQRADGSVWVERSLEQYPHIRLHGGVREDDPPK